MSEAPIMFVLLTSLPELSEAPIVFVFVDTIAKNVGSGKHVCFIDTIAIIDVQQRTHTLLGESFAQAKDKYPGLSENLITELEEEEKSFVDLVVTFRISLKFTTCDVEPTGSLGPRPSARDVRDGRNVQIFLLL